VIVAAPHTSNWDFFPAMGVIYKLQSKKAKPRFIIKKSWLFFPMNLILGPMGAFGVERNNASGINQTDMLADIFKQHQDFIMMISPEGTRSPNDQWKTGFYTVALKANVPIALAYADYTKKEVGIAKVIYPKNFEDDMRLICDVYKTIQGKTPRNFKLDKRFSQSS
jgi:1-acyl-sn-glycerol-3-phosphate acyltransferase